VKQTLFVSDSAHLAIASALSAGPQLRFVDESALRLRLAALQATASVLVEARPLEQVAFVLAPNVTAISGPIDVDQVSALQDGSRLVGGASGTLVLNLSERVRLLAEVGVFSGALQLAPGVDPNSLSWNAALALRYFSPSPTRASGQWP
jgi:hypothetical protein